MFFNGVVVARCEDDSRNVALHVGDFFGALIDEKQDKFDVRVIVMDAVRDVLEEDGFSRTRRSDDEPALAEAYGSEQIDDPGGVFSGIVLEAHDGFGVEGGAFV